MGNALSLPYIFQCGSTYEGLGKVSSLGKNVQAPGTHARLMYVLAVVILWGKTNRWNVGRVLSSSFITKLIASKLIKSVNQCRKQVYDPSMWKNTKKLKPLLFWVRAAFKCYGLYLSKNYWKGSIFGRFNLTESDFSCEYFALMFEWPYEILACLMICIIIIYTYESLHVSL